MAIKQSINFGIQLHGDGSATSVTITLATAAISYASPTGEALSDGFTLTSLSPSGVKNLTCSDSTITVTGSIGLLGSTMTLNFSSALAVDTDYVIDGTFVF